MSLFESTFWTPGSIEFRYREFECIPVVERQYLAILNEILNKPNWWKKLQDEAIQNRWKEELNQYLRDVDTYGLIDSTTETSADAGSDVDDENKEENGDEDSSRHGLCFKYLLEELNDIIEIMDDWKAGDDEVQITPITAHGVYLVDNLISSLIRDRLVAAAQKLDENVKDMCLSGNSQVVDLIHPSLYCLIFGKTWWSMTPGAAFGEHLTPTNTSNTYSQPDVSAKFQWIPSEFFVNSDGEVSIKSYINNLSSRDHPEMYEIAQVVFQRMVPLFERTLACLESEPTNRVEVNQRGIIEYRYDYYSRLWKDHKAANGIPEDNNDGRNEFIDNLYNNDVDDRPINYPKFPSEYDSQNWRIDDIYSLRDKKLQVIVKMSSIHLTPENPTFKGGNWHLEGMENEAIAATGIYYYDIDNITESRLSFRHLFDAESFEYPQNESKGIELVYDIENEVSDNVQPSGFITAIPGRCITFPNFHHHKVEPFELADKTRPGHRKILCFFLIHPDYHIPSTRYIPSQRYDDVIYFLHRCFESVLPEPLLELIASFLGCGLTKTEAIEYAKELSEERKNALNEEGYSNTQRIFFCEH